MGSLTLDISLELSDMEWEDQELMFSCLKTSLHKPTSHSHPWGFVCDISSLKNIHLTLKAKLKCPHGCEGFSNSVNYSDPFLISIMFGCTIHDPPHTPMSTRVLVKNMESFP